MRIFQRTDQLIKRIKDAGGPEILFHAFTADSKKVAVPVGNIRRGAVQYAEHTTDLIDPLVTDNPQKTGDKSQVSQTLKQPLIAVTLMISCINGREIKAGYGLKIRHHIEKVLLWYITINGPRNKAVTNNRISHLSKLLISAEKREFIRVSVLIKESETVRRLKRHQRIFHTELINQTAESVRHGEGKRTKL
ncbi:hypothetical protein EC142370_04486 [Escherichia coli O145:H34]|nr:hypothetical protein EC142370_04486 [Escherichia coli O145:H34]